jgi:uncharacterized repeat protein (TIGR01451 family)
MKKNLITLILCFVSLCSVWGQWEKISQQFIEGINQTQYVFHKDIMGVFTQRGNGIVIYYSTNRGNYWKKIETPFKGNPNSLSREYVSNNSEGFYLIEREQQNPQFIVHRTSDFGRTWVSDTLFTLDKAFISFYKKDNDVCIRSRPVLTNNLDTNYCYTFKNRKWVKDNYPIIHSDISKNRQWREDGMKNQLVVDDFEGKNLANIDLKNYNRGAGRIFYVQDSIVVMINNYTQTPTMYISNNLGKTWNVSEYPENPAQGISINGSTVYAYCRKLHKTDDLGKTWTSISDNVFNDYSQTEKHVISNFHFVDTMLYLTYGSRYWSKSINETKWIYCNNTTTDFNVIKADDSTLIAVHNYNFLLQSKNWGKTWSQPHSFTRDFQTSSEPDQQLVIAADNSLFSNYGKKSSDYGKTWSQESIFPRFISHFKKGDTLIIKPYKSYPESKILFSLKSPYNKWDTLNFTQLDIYERFQFLHFDKGAIWIAIYNDRFQRVNIKRIKLDKTELEISTLENTIKVEVSNDKIWAIPSSVIVDNKIRYSGDLGKTWTSFDLPQGTNTNNFLLKPIGDFLLLKRVKSTNSSVAAISVSADNGKSWFSFDKNLEDIIGYQSNIPITVIDSFIYNNSISNGLWRANISDMQLKSLSGTVFIDKNKNGIKDTDEKGFPNAKVFLSNAGAFTTADSLGNYAFLADLKATDTLKASIDSKYATYTPQYLLVSQSDTVKNIGVFIPANLQDLVVNGTAITPPRSGFTNSYLLTYKNVGTATKSGKVTLAYNAKQTYIEATQAPTSNVNNTLSWDYANLQPNESRTLKVTFKTAADVLIRTQLTNVATIEPIATDTFKTDNVDSLFQIVVGSYDPNDKQVSFLNTRQTPSVIDPNTEMTYTIRFQNTGNYQADFVRVTDTLSDKLDLTTLRVLATSHNYTLSVKNKNVLQFEFNPIYLPDSTTNEKESHGFIKFAIKPKKTLTKDEVIKNTAYIFFDYNPAIITNTVETANQKVNGLFTPSVLESLSVFPNPTNGEISFILDKYQGKALSINVYSIDGKLMMNKHTVGEAVNRINGESLRNGFYVLQVRVGDDIVFGKFMVQK